MKPETRFKKMYYKLPKRARSRLNYFIDGKPISLTALTLEVKNKTKLADKILKDLGYEEESD